MAVYIQVMQVKSDLWFDEMMLKFIPFVVSAHGPDQSNVLKVSCLTFCLLCWMSAFSQHRRRSRDEEGDNNAMTVLFSVFFINTY